MITVSFENKGELGLCEYLVESLKTQILNGELKGNEKLPSKRALAEHLGVSVITVQNAYGELISQGFIYTIEKVGFYVTDLEENSKIAITTEPEIKNLNKEKNKEDSTLDYFTDFKNNSANLEKFPFREWSQLMRKVLNANNMGLLQRQSVFGVKELQEAISKYLYEFRNMHVSPQQIVIGAGTETLYTMLVQFLGRDKLYAVENPGYHKTPKIFSINGARCIPVQIDSEGILVNHLNKLNIDVVHVSPNHHFPTGLIMPIKRRQELIMWAAQKSNRYIIEDDYDSEFRFDGKALAPLQNQDVNGKVIYINTFSKTLSPSFRISYMVLPQNLMDEFSKRMGFYSCSVSAVEQYTLSRFINLGYFEKHIIRMKNYYRNLRNQFIKSLNTSKLNNNIEILEAGAGLHFLLKIKSKKNYGDLRENLLQNGINISLLSDFYIGEPSENAFIVNYSGLEKEKISETVSRMEKALL